MPMQNKPKAFGKIHRVIAFVDCWFLKTALVFDAERGNSMCLASGIQRRSIISKFLSKPSMKWYV